MRSANFLVILAIHLSQHVLKAEKYDLTGIKVPGNWTLKELYAFFVYSKADAPLGGSLGGHDTNSTASFAEVTASSNKYDGIEISLVRYEDLRHIPLDFCCTQNDVDVGRCAKVNQIRLRGTQADESDVFRRSLGPGDDSTSPKLRAQEKGNVTTSGVYVLIVSNCGTLDVNVTLGGHVLVKNPFGWLSGVDYYKMPFYACLSILYVVFALLWLLLCCLYRKELFRIQWCIMLVLLLGLGEAALWFINFFWWNEMGSRAWPVFICALAFSVTKSVFSYMLVLVGTMGWGITKPYLGCATAAKIILFSVVYIILDFARRVVLSMRHSSRDLPATFLFLCLVPVSLMNGGLFYWVFSSLGNLINTLKNENQLQKMKLFQRLWGILILALTIATLSQLHEFFSLSRSIEERWKMQWLFGDGVSHLLFLFVLIGMMVLWRPHKDSQIYAFSQQLGDKEMDDGITERPTFVISDEEEGDLSTSASGQVKPTTLGASTAKDATQVSAAKDYYQPRT